MSEFCRNHTKGDEKLNSNFTNHNDGPTWQDAAKIALILTIAALFTTYLTDWTATTITEAPIEFMVGIFKFFGAAFFTNFIALAGLNKLTQKKDEENGPAE